MLKIFFLLCSLAFFDIPQSKKPLYEKCIKPTVLIKAISDKSSGTGFIIRSQKAIENYYINTVISCAHVCEEKIKIYVPVYNESKISEYKQYNSIVILLDRLNDMSVIVFFSDKPHQTVDVDFDSENFIDDDVFIVGCGLGESPRLSKGFVSGISNDDVSIRTSISCVPGDSGSALFKNNKVIGICVGIKNWNGQLVTDISIFKMLGKLKETLNKNLHFLINKEDKSIPKLFYYSLLERIGKWDIYIHHFRN